jgi:uncharacterized protein
MEHTLAFELVDIPEGESHREVSLPAESLELAVPDVRLAAPLDIRLELFRSGDSIRIQGEFRDRLAFVCGRCLSEEEAEFSGRFDIFCEKRERDIGDEDRQALEEGGMVFHDGKVLDLFEEIRQSVVLEIPWNPLCRPECSGLCPRCGKNLNEGRCDCVQDGDSRWAPLKRLLS